MTSEKRFGIHKATGIDMSTHKNRPTHYSLVERGQIVMTIPSESYGLLVNKKKELAIYGRKCEIKRNA